MPPPLVDTTEFPIVFIRFQPGLTLEDIDTHGATFMRLFEERGSFLTIADLDTLQQKDMTAMHRRRIADSANRLSARSAFLAEYVVTVSAVVRGVFTAYCWLSRSKHPRRAFATRQQAVDEALRVLGKGIARAG